MPTLNLTPDALLSTTRSVRKGMDFSRPVGRDVIEDCLELAVQAPHQGNAQAWRFVVVTDQEKRQALAEIYRRGWAIYEKVFARAQSRSAYSTERQAVQSRVLSSAQYLAKHLHEAPVLLVPCISPRPDGASAISQSAQWGSIAPATWSFMLAARARGLATVWTSVHLFFEEEAAAVLGIPYPEAQQACLVPVAYSTRQEFSPARREPLQSVVRWNGWQEG